MVTKIIKEIILALLTILLAILLFAIVLYEYIPSRKVVPEIAEYKVTEKISEQLADDIDKKNEQVVLTYEVTSSDLNNYKITNDYVPGKANPFEDYTQSVEANATENQNSTSGGNSTDGNSTGGNTSEENSSSGGIKGGDTNTEGQEEPETK